MAKSKSKKVKTISHKGAPVWGVIPSGFKRISLTYGDKTYNFKINPSNYKYNRDTRSAIYKTQGSNVNQQFGSDIPTIAMSGTTGWHKDASGNTGKDRLESLNKIVAQYQNDTQYGGAPHQDFWLYNYTDSKKYKVSIDKFEYDRDKTEPLLFYYTIEMHVLGGSDTPPENTELTSVVGTGSGSSISPGTDANSPVTTAQKNLVDTATNPHATKKDIKKAIKKLKKKHGK